ncbi:MAG: hypothetical protein ACI84K_001283 [Pseudohongiellaceae bacterium]|jgi:hypothetical protein
MIYWLAIPVLVLIIAVLNFTFYNKKQQQIKKQNVRYCLHKLVQLKSLLILIQQHRGQSTAYLHGDQNVFLSILQLRKQVDKQWRTLSTDYPALTTDKLFEGIHNHWDRLKVRFEALQATNNIDQHNRLLNNLLYLIENQAEQNIALTKMSRAAGLGIIWKELLDTIEAIGQTRAIGVGIVASRKSTAVERIQLKFLVDKVNNRLNELEKSLNTSKSLASKPTDINMAWSKAFTQQAKINAEQLTLFINNQLLQDKVISISTEAFFNLASNTIKPLDEIFNQTSNRLMEEYFS